MGYASPNLKQKIVRVEGNIPADPRRHLFLKAKMSYGKSSQVPFARILSHQGSHMLSSLADAEGFLQVPAGENRGLKKKQFQMDFLPYKMYR
jgi:molybdopterin biosynthesis enzyme